MKRKTLLAVAANAAALALVVAGLPAGTSLVAQESDAATDGADAAGGSVVELDLGERYEGELWDIEAQELFLAESPDRTAWSEVRIGIALRNNLPQALPYSSTAFFDGDGYPRLALVDAFDVTRSYDMLRPGADAIPGSNVHEIPPDLTGRWTVGFEVPTVNSGFLRLQLIDPLAGVVAVWDLTTSTDPAGWDAPPLETVAVGETFPWGDEGLAAVPVRYGTLVCGDADSQLVTQILALQLDVTNANFTDDVAFPGVREPRTAAVAQWPDGSTARMSYETFGGETEELRKFASDLVFIPPTDNRFFARGLLFGVTKDPRLSDVAEGPQGIRLNLPDGTSRWLVLDGPGDLTVNPRFCDRNLFDGALPLAYTPGGDLDVGGAEPPGPTDEDLDRTTAEAMVQAVIVLGQAVQGVDDLQTVTAADLEALWPQLTFVDGLLLSAVGVIGIQALDEDDLLMITLSPTGRYFCAGLTVGEPVRLADGEDFDATLNACLPPDLTPEEEQPEQTTTTTSTTTTTVP